ncbi:MAG: mechanosensitive ion channel family protein [Dysgonomonas sp.]
MFTDVIAFVQAELPLADVDSISKLQQILDKLIDASILFGQKLIAAVVVYFVGRWLINFLKKFFHKLLNRKQIDPAVQSFLASLINISLNIILVILVIGILGISTTSFAALIAAAGLAVGMAMKDNLSNFAGGVMILINKPFKIGDRIVVQGLDGVVKSIGILYTVLVAADNKTLYVPNGPLSTGNITNFSTQANRRVDITLNLAYGNDLDNLKAILTTLIDAEPKILKDPATFVGITAIYNGNIDITIRSWVKNEDFVAVSTYLNEAIYNTLSEKGIYVPSSMSVRLLKD